MNDPLPCRDDPLSVVTTGEQADFVALQFGL